MEKVVIDARGLSCPQPVVLVRNAMKGCATEIEVKVDSMAACENISRFAEQCGYLFESSSDASGTIITRLIKP